MYECHFENGIESIKKELDDKIIMLYFMNFFIEIFGVFGNNVFYGIFINFVLLITFLLFIYFLNFPFELKFQGTKKRTKTKKPKKSKN